MPAYFESGVWLASDGAPWHGLGTPISDDQAMDLDVVQDLAGHGFTVTKVGLSYEGETVPGVFGMVPSTTGIPFPGVSVGSKYTPFQNGDAYDMLRDILGFGDIKIRTAGVLKGGRVCWALVQLPGFHTVRRRDGTLDTSTKYLLVSWTHDGSGRIKFKLTDIRVVCRNTLQASFSEKDKPEVNLKHTRNVKQRASQVADVLGLADEHFKIENEVLQALADRRVSPGEMADFGLQLFTEKDSAEEAREHYAKVNEKGGRSLTILDNKLQALVRAFNDAKMGNRGEDAYDALNGVTQLVDHGRDVILDTPQAKEQQDLIGGLADRHFRREGQQLLSLGTEEESRAYAKAERKLDSAWFGTGANLKQRAVDLLVQTL